MRVIHQIIELRRRNLSHKSAARESYSLLGFRVFLPEFFKINGKLTNFMYDGDGLKR